MHDEMKTEAMELCVTACEKFSSNNEVHTKQFLFFLLFYAYFVEFYFREQLE